MENKHSPSRRIANVPLKNPRAGPSSTCALLLPEYGYTVLQRRPVVGGRASEIGAVRSKSQQRPCAQCGHMPFLCTLYSAGPVCGRGPDSDPRLWVILLASRGFLEDARIQSSRAPGVFGPQDKLASALPCRPCWLCRRPVANQTRHQRLRKIDMSCFQCSMKHVQSGVHPRLPSVGAARAARELSGHHEDWQDSRQSTHYLSSSFLLAGCLVKQKSTAENSITVFDTSRKCRMLRLDTRGTSSYVARVWVCDTVLT